MQQARSQIAQRREQAAKTKAVVMTLLQWTELEYAEFQYESGLAYLRHYIPWDKWGQDMLQRSKLFWNWWKNQWALRDESFCAMDSEVPTSEVGISTANLRRLYYHLHDAAILASDIYPNRTVLEESYNQMIHQLNKEEIHG